jgi:hypothetical protein
LDRSYQWPGYRTEEEAVVVVVGSRLVDLMVSGVPPGLSILG